MRLLIRYEYTPMLRKLPVVVSIPKTVNDNKY